MNRPRQSSRSIGRRSFGSFGNRPILKTAVIGDCRKPKAGRIHNYPFRRVTEGK